jgi:hypothetical protein
MHRDIQLESALAVFTPPLHRSPNSRASRVGEDLERVVANSAGGRMYPFELVEDPSESVVDAVIVEDIGHVASDLANLLSASNPTSQLPRASLTSSTAHISLSL